MSWSRTRSTHKRWSASVRSRCGKLLEAVALGVSDDDTLTSLAGRLVKLERKLSDADWNRIKATGAEQSPAEMAGAILTALELDSAMGAESSPGFPQYEALIEQALRPLAANPALRALLAEIHERNEQALDTVSVDRLLEAGFAPEDSEKARATVELFRQFIEDNKDEITALQIIFSIPERRKPLTTKDTKSTKETQNQSERENLGTLGGSKDGRLTYDAVKELAAILEQPPHTWTTERLWRAYAQLERDRVRGVNERRVLADLVSLVRHAVQFDDELTPYPARVAVRYHAWLAAQQAGGRVFTPEQRWWLDQIAEHIGVNLAVRPDDLSVGAFYNKGGQFAAARVFGEGLPALLDELNMALGE